MSDLISPGLMEEIVKIDESAMPARALVFGLTVILDDRGGEKTVFAPKHTEPIAARLIPGSPTTNDRGGILISVEEAVMSLSLTGLRDQDVMIDNDDEIDFTTTLHLPGEDVTGTNRYRVNGTPSVGPYSSALSFPVTKVG